MPGPTLRRLCHRTIEHPVHRRVEQVQPALVVLVPERRAGVHRLVRPQRVALVPGLAEQLPRPEVDQFRDVHRPVDVGSGEHRTEHVVHRHVAVELDDEPVQVVAGGDVGPFLFEGRWAQQAGSPPSSTGAIGIDSRHDEAMSTDAATGFDLDEIDRLLTTTKQVRKRLDLTRPVPNDLLLDIIEIANHAPMGGNLERNRWLIVTDPDLKAEIAERFAAVGRPYLAANSEVRPDDRSQKVIDSAEFLVDHLAEVPALVIAMRLDRPPLDPSTQGGAAAYYGSVLPGVWSFQLTARARGIGSAWTTFHLEHEAEIAELLGIPPTVTQVCLLAVGYYTGETFSPAPRRPAREVTFLNRWKQPVEALGS